jgi:hypothetical protein
VTPQEIIADCTEVFLPATFVPTVLVFVISAYLNGFSWHLSAPSPDRPISSGLYNYPSIIIPYPISGKEIKA